jgi:hypothetical protein
MEQPWNIDDTEMVMLRPRELDLQNVVGEPLRKVVEFSVMDRRKPHQRGGLDIRSILSICGGWTHLV